MGNYYHRLIIQYSLSPKFSLGPMEQSGMGWGPRFEYKLGKKWKIWAAPLEKGSEAAVGYSF